MVIEETHSYFTSIQSVCCQVWPTKEGLLRKLVSVALYTQTWPGRTLPADMSDALNTSLTNRVLIWQTVSSAVWCGAHRLNNRQVCSVRPDSSTNHIKRKPGSPKQCLHSCQAATHTQTLAYITVRRWRSADTNTPKQKPEAYVTPSVQAQVTPLLTIPTWEAPWKIKTAKPFWESFVGHGLCVLVCVYCTCRAWSGMPYKGSQQKRQARQL